MIYVHQLWWLLGKYGYWDFRSFQNFSVSAKPCGTDGCCWFANTIKHHVWMGDLFLCSCWLPGDPDPPPHRGFPASSKAALLGFGVKESHFSNPYSPYFCSTGWNKLQLPLKAKDLYGFIHLAKHRWLLMEHKACCSHVEVNKQLQLTVGWQDLDLHPTGISVQEFYHQYCMCWKHSLCPA